MEQHCLLSYLILFIYLFLFYVWFEVNPITRKRHGALQVNYFWHFRSPLELVVGVGIIQVIWYLSFTLQCFAAGPLR